VSRVEINAGGRHVVVDHQGELAHLAKTATELWESTAGAEPDSPAAVGFVTSQRFEPPPVSMGSYAGRPRPTVTGEVSDASA
jgi:hypothetical protein